MAGADTEVAVIGGGVVGCAVAHALARRGVKALLLEAEGELAHGASGTNSGILHTGFDSTPGELETRLILRAAELREQLLDELAVPVWRCGARLRPRDADEREAVALLAANARANGVEATREADGSLASPARRSPTRSPSPARSPRPRGRGGATHQAGRPRWSGCRRQAASCSSWPAASALRARARRQLRRTARRRARPCRRGRAGGGVPAQGRVPRVRTPPPRQPLQEILLPVPSAHGQGRARVPDASIARR